MRERWYLGRQEKDLHRRGLYILAGVLVLAAAAVPAGASAGVADRLVERDLEVASRVLASGPPRQADPRSWTSGFYPGSLWLMAELTGDRAWRTRARAAQRRLWGQWGNADTHDVGFIVLTPFGRCHKLTRSAACRRAVVRAAGSLASRFDPQVGSTRSWGRAGERRFTVIVDNLMNLELLLWAERRGGPREWRTMAVRHGRTALRNHVRPDGSTFHVVDYDSDTGAVLARRTHQGAADGSTWSRGQAWAIHGFTTLYRYTRYPRFLAAARKVARYWLHRMPRGGVPPWDFDVAAAGPPPYDSSAGAIAASGLLDLARLERSERRAGVYHRVAMATLRELSSRRFLARRGPWLLKHGTADGARGRFGGGLPYGDYYFLEALARLRASG